MKRKLYGTFRKRDYSAPVNMGDISMNGGYDLPFFNRGQFRDYEEAGITKVSAPISEDNYVGKLPKIDADENVIGEVPRLTRFFVLEFSDKFANEAEVRDSLLRSSSDSAVKFFATADDTRTWLRENTDLPETEEGFEIRKAGKNPFTEEDIPAEFIHI